MENQKIHIQAIEDIARYACVTSDGRQASSHDTFSENNIIGVTEGTIKAGEWGDSTIAGILFNDDWDWNPGQGLFLNGSQIAQTLPSGGFLQQVGWALTPKSVLINIQSGGTPAPYSNQVPRGIIAMWSGPIGSVPGGWALCNGAGGTPNLSDKFIRGVPPLTDPGGTGGANTHTHSNHVFTPVGTVSQPTFTGDEQTFTTVPAGTEADQAMATPNPYTPSGTVSQPTFTGGQVTLSHSTADNIPEYFYLAFIIKL